MADRERFEMREGSREESVERIWGVELKYFGGLRKDNVERCDVADEMFNERSETGEELLRKSTSKLVKGDRKVDGIRSDARDVGGEVERGVVPRFILDARQRGV
jgi:hypothetical protein